MDWPGSLCGVYGEDVQAAVQMIGKGGCPAMRRHSGQKALYEAMSRSRAKPKRLGLLERLRPQLQKLRKAGAARLKRPAGGPEPAVEKPAPVVLKPPKSLEEVPEKVAQGPAQTWLRPKALQFNEGRIEVALPYQIGIIIGLGLTLLVLIAFWFGHRLGQIDQRARYGRASQSAGAGVGDVTARAAEPHLVADNSGVPEAADDTTSAQPTGYNVIVLARHRLETQLVPVQTYFRDHGVETRIFSYARLRAHFAEYGLDASNLPTGDGFMLVTNKLYNNPEREGTDGYAAKLRIIELGRGYQAPEGFESFAASRFSDAYGMKIAK